MLAQVICGKEPGGPIGQELMFNYIKVQPYFGEDGDDVEERADARAARSPFMDGSGSRLRGRSGDEYAVLFDGARWVR